MSRIALIGENSIEYISNLIDIWNDGHCALLIDWRIPFEKSLEMMNDAGAKKCVIEKKFFCDENIYTNDIEFVTYERETSGTCYLSDEVRKKFKNRYTTEEAVVIYSSGTTGKARGIVLSHYAINSNADSIIDYMSPSTADCIYTIRSLSHSSTITGELLVALKSGAQLLIGPIIVPPRVILGNVSKYKVTILGVNPTILSILSVEYAKKDYDISSLKTIYSAGALLNQKVCSESRSVFSKVEIYNSYGLTEAGPRVTAQTKDHCNGNSVGVPIKNVEIAIIDTNGKKVCQGEKGIIHVNSTGLFNGYITGGTKHISLYNGWLNTGDVGYIDSLGELHIIDRIDDVIIINAHKIYPAEVEKQVLAIKGVNECVVTEVEYNDTNIIGCLYVSETVSEKDIRAYLKVNLMSFEIPQVFVQMQAIPKTLNGKNSKKESRFLIEKYLNDKKR